MKVNVIGVGHTLFGKLDLDIGSLMYEAGKQALEDANISIEEIDAVYIANFSSSFAEQIHLPAVFASKFNVNKEITRVESACASGGLAIKEAVISIASGLYGKVLVVGVEKMSESSQPADIIARAASKNERSLGMTFPSLFALMARQHFHCYGTTEQHLAEVAVKNHRNALSNPFAQFHKEITVDDVMKSKMVASPLKLLDCAPITDGAAAVVMQSSETNSSVRLLGIGHNTDAIELFKRPDITTIPTVSRAAEQAFKMSQLVPKDIDVIEVHDCFTIAELIEIEDLGFCKKGDSKKIMEEGRSEVSGDMPVNPSGGLKAKGHAIGATGVSQVVEIVKQLRGQASNQVKGARFGLCCNIGGAGSSAVVSILSGE